MDLPGDGRMMPVMPVGRGQQSEQRDGFKHPAGRVRACGVGENPAWSQLAVLTCCDNSLRPKAACSGTGSPALCSALFAILQLRLGDTQLRSHLLAAS